MAPPPCRSSRMRPPCWCPPRSFREPIQRVAPCAGRKDAERTEEAAAEKPGPLTCSRRAALGPSAPFPPSYNPSMTQDHESPRVTTKTRGDRLLREMLMPMSGLTALNLSTPLTTLLWPLGQQAGARILHAGYTPY